MTIFSVYDDAFSSMVCSIYRGSSDGVVTSANQVTLAHNGQMNMNNNVVKWKHITVEMNKMGTNVSRIRDPKG
jgi:predicted ATP-grasp superfamily ATP-dependent carboligase